MNKKSDETAKESVSGALVRIFGPPAEELAAIFQTRLKYHRWKQSIKIIEEAKAECSRRGIEFNPPPLKFLVPFLEQASLEDDDIDLTSMWSNLLVGAVSDFQSRKIAYISVLERISSSDAAYLRTLFEKIVDDGDFDDFDPDLTMLRDREDMQNLSEYSLGHTISRVAPDLRTLFYDYGIKGDNLGEAIKTALAELASAFGTRFDIVFANYSISGFIGDQYEWSICGPILTSESEIQATHNARVNGLMDMSSVVFEKKQKDGRKTYRVSVSASYYWLNGFGLEFLKCCMKSE